MQYIIYPQRRQVSDDTVIAWAKDSLCDLALAGITDEQEAECIIASVRYGNHNLTLQEAIAILEDEGSVTFGSERLYARLTTHHNQFHREG